MSIKQEETFTFEIHFNGNHVVFSLGSENIRIDKRSSRGSISSYSGPDEFKLHMIAKYIDSKKLWDLRIQGFVKQATRIREIQRKFNFVRD